MTERDTRVELGEGEADVDSLMQDVSDLAMCLVAISPLDLRNVNDGSVLIYQDSLSDNPDFVSSSQIWLGIEPDSTVYLDFLDRSVSYAEGVVSEEQKYRKLCFVREGVGRVDENLIFSLVTESNGDITCDPIDSDDGEFLYELNNARAVLLDALSTGVNKGGISEVQVSVPLINFFVRNLDSSTNVSIRDEDRDGVNLAELLVRRDEHEIVVELSTFRYILPEVEHEGVFLTAFHEINSAKRSFEFDGSCIYGLRREIVFDLRSEGFSKAIFRDIERRTEGSRVIVERSDWQTVNSLVVSSLLSLLE